MRITIIEFSVPRETLRALTMTMATPRRTPSEKLNLYSTSEIHSSQDLFGSGANCSKNMLRLSMK